MRFWLFKSEPSAWSFAQQMAEGAKGTEWTGVRNYGARNHMREMRVGDRGLFYHSNEGKAVVGVVAVSNAAHPDSTAPGTAWECVDIVGLREMPAPVTLEAVRSDPALRDMVLVNNSRLSVQPVREGEFRRVCELAGLSFAEATAAVGALA